MNPLDPHEPTQPIGAGKPPEPSPLFEPTQPLSAQPGFSQPEPFQPEPFQSEPASDPAAGQTSSAGSAGSAGPGTWSGSGRAPEGAGAGVRTSTVVWGVLVLLVSALVLASVIGWSIDVQLAGIIALATAGVLLLLGALGSAVRARRRRV